MLPELLEPNADEQIVIVEGEKDVDTLTANGILAKTNSEGAGKWRSEWPPFFERRHIVIIPDNDDPGRRHAEAVALMLQEGAYSVKILHPPDLPRHGDVSDWFDAGHTRDELIELIDATQLHKPAQTASTPATSMVWAGNKHRPVALQIIERLKSHGFFVRSMDGRHYFFDTTTKKLGEVSAKENSFEIVLVLNRTKTAECTSGISSQLHSWC